MDAAMANGRETTTAGAGKYLTFRLGEEEYGIDILKVQEIRGYEPPTRVANAPAFVKGVSNLRGAIVPIIDMRLRLHCADAECSALTVVIILNLRGRVLGLVVDSVSDVVELAGDQIRPAPDVCGAAGVHAIGGLGLVGERMLILLDIETLVAGDDLGWVPAPT